MTDKHTLVEELRSYAASEEINLHDSPHGPASLIHARTLRQAATRITALEAREAELVEALDSVMVGGNHLALLIGTDHPPFTTEPFAALEHYGASDTYEIWCCWRSIMLARATLAKHREGEGK